MDVLLPENLRWRKSRRPGRTSVRGPGDLTGSIPTRRLSKRARLFETGAVVGGHEGEVGNLIATRARRRRGGSRTNARG
jgi:hypothetical protein